MKIDILIPTYMRAAKLTSVIANARDNSPGCGIIVIGEPDDPATEHVATELGWQYIDRMGVSIYAGAINTGAMASDADWVFCAADDLEFTPGWLDAMRFLMRGNKAHVIATNDMHNPGVMAGRDGTHNMVRMAYVKSVGATWTDGPGVVLHEGYRHYGPDNEIVEVAKVRGCFSPCLDSVVIHHQDDAAKAKHPTRQADKDYFKLRRRMWQK
jgi:glycosyltransferase involved in cell wall biosynthesis